jgi:hypothetical protein
MFFLTGLNEGIAPVLMFKILELVRSSGADRTDALCAIQGAEAMVPALELDPKPYLRISDPA